MEFGRGGGKGAARWRFNSLSSDPELIRLIRRRVSIRCAERAESAPALSDEAMRSNTAHLMPCWTPRIVALALRQSTSITRRPWKKKKKSVCERQLSLFKQIRALKYGTLIVTFSLQCLPAGLSPILIDSAPTCHGYVKVMWLIPFITRSNC